jgi:hypothetical protein
VAPATSRSTAASSPATSAASWPASRVPVGRLAYPAGAGKRLHHPTRGDAQPQLAEQPGDLARRHPSPLLSHEASATARGPTWVPAAPSASEVWPGWRGWTLRLHERQRPIWIW